MFKSEFWGLGAIALHPLPHFLPRFLGLNSLISLFPHALWPFWCLVHIRSHPEPPHLLFHPHFRPQSHAYVRSAEASIS